MDATPNGITIGRKCGPVRDLELGAGASDRTDLELPSTLWSRAAQVKQRSAQFEHLLMSLYAAGP
jgi:hypothetical protein